MHNFIIEQMVRRLSPVLKDQAKAGVILKRFWHTRMALVWMVEDMHRAANEREVALTNDEAIDVLQTLLDQHNAQYGLRWSDITTHITENVLGRKLTKREIHRFVHHNKLTIQR